MATTKLIRSASWYNPMICNGRELCNIIIYKDGEKVFETNCGWFGRGTNNRWDSIDLPFEVKRANKVNMERDDAFMHKGELYIHWDLLQTKKTKSDFLYINTWSQKTYADEYTIVLSGVINKEKVANIADSIIHVTRSEDTDEYIKCKELSGKLKEECFISLGAFEVHELLEKFDLVPKKI